MEIFDQAPVPVDIASMMGIVVTGATAAVNVSAGQYVILQHSTISGVADGLYKAVNAKTAGTAFVSGDLTAVTTGGYNSINSDKVDISDIANNLTTNTAGKVLDARQGKALSEQMANIPNNVVSSYNTLVEPKDLTTTETVYNTYNSRKFSDYDVLFFTIIVANYIRESVIIPKSVFSGYSSTGTSLNYTTGGVNVEIVVKYNTDTSVKMKYNATSSKNVTVRIDALALENKA